MTGVTTQQPSWEEKKAQPSAAALRKAGADYARKQINIIFSKSRHDDLSDEFPSFTKEELVMGKILGKGGFCTVNEIKGFQIKGVASGNKRGKKGDADYVLNDDEMEGKQFIAEHCIRANGDARYAVKYLSKENIDDPAMFIQAIKDMAIETRVMSTLEHPNIVKLRGMAFVDPYNEKYFIVMDRLYDTLEKRIEKWGKQSKRTSGLRASFQKKKCANKANELLEERMVAAFDLSAALSYLHDRKIIYRDLKPENIGFDVRGDIKVFDFGLAKEILEEHEDNPQQYDTYQLTGDTGSIRYMAPEVGLLKPYNYTVDTYSFCIMLWEMLACKKPFELYTMKTFKERVWAGEKKRPLVPADWAVPVKLLLKKGWSDNVSERLSMKSVYNILKKECTRLRDGDASALEHERRRSTFVFRGNKPGAKLPK